MKSHDFNAVSSKLYAGTLKNGRGYIVFNYVPSGKLVDDIEDVGITVVRGAQQHAVGLFLAHHGDLDQPRIVQLVFDLLRDVL